MSSNQPPEGGIRILLLLLSFLIPLAGVIVGVIYLQHDNPASKEFAKHAFITAVASFALICICSVCAGAAPILLEGSL